MTEYSKIQFLGLILFLGVVGSLSAPIEEAQFLRQIADQYNLPLVISFLHSRMESEHVMIDKISASLEDLPKSKRDLFDLASRTIQSLDNQLITLEKTGYFDIDGKDKVNYFIDQFIMLNKLQPIDFGSYGLVKSPITPDSLLEQLKTQSPGILINQIGTLIKSYQADLTSKESSPASNNGQKLLISLVKREFQSILGHLNGIGINNYDRINEMEKVLRSLKTIVDLFYFQFNHLSGEHGGSNEPSELVFPTGKADYDNDPYRNFTINEYGEMNETQVIWDAWEPERNYTYYEVLPEGNYTNYYNNYKYGTTYLTTYRPWG